MTPQLAWSMLLSLRGLTLAILSSMGLPDKDLAKLQRIQNIAARLICRVPPSHHITPILQNLHWLPVNTRIAYKINLLTYKSNAGLSPTYLSDLLHDYVPSRTLRPSSQSLLQLPRRIPSKSYGQRSFFHAAPFTMEQLTTANPYCR